MLSSSRKRLLLILIAGSLAPVAALANTSHVGWPPMQRLIMDKGPAGETHVLRGTPQLHNWILGGYGNDTIVGGNAGDVLWGDYHPSGWPAHQVAYIYGGNGKNFIYSNDTVNYVWTGTNSETLVHALTGSGIIHCQSPGITVLVSHADRWRYKLEGCRKIVFR